MPTLELNRPQSDSFHAVRPGITQCFPWGRGVGKSWWMRQIAYYLINKYDGKPRQGGPYALRGIRLIWLMPSLKQFKKVHGALLEAELGSDWAGLGANINHTDFRIEFPGGSWIQPFPAQMHSSRGALGQRVDGVLIDETDDIEPTIHHGVVEPWFSEPWSLNYEFAGGTPRRGRHGLLYHLHSLGLDPTKPSYWTRHATWRDSPKTVSAKRVARAKETTPPAIFKREWECDFDAAEGLVYGDVWDERFHVIGAEDCPHTETPKHCAEFIVGGDAGYATPGCLLLIGIVGKGADAVCFVFDEVYRAGETEDFWVAAAAKWGHQFPGSFLYMDPGGGGAALDARIIADTKLRRGEIHKDVDAGIRAVATLLKIHGEGDERRARLYVHPRCKNLIYEMGAYKRKRDSTDPDRYLEQVVKKHDHAQDALRYATFSHFPAEAIGGRQFRPLDVRTA